MTHANAPLTPEGRGSARSVVGCLIFSGSGVLVRARRDPHGDDEGVYSIPSPARPCRHVIFHDDRLVAPALGPGSQEPYRSPRQARGTP